jgi:hypothetical protein
MIALGIVALCVFLLLGLASIGAWHDIRVHGLPAHRPTRREVRQLTERAQSTIDKARGIDAE